MWPFERFHRENKVPCTWSGWEALQIIEDFFSLFNVPCYAKFITLSTYHKVLTKTFHGNRISHCFSFSSCTLPISIWFACRELFWELSFEFRKKKFKKYGVERIKWFKGFKPRRWTKSFLQFYLFFHARKISIKTMTCHWIQSTE